VTVSKTCDIKLKESISVEKSLTQIDSKLESIDSEHSKESPVASSSSSTTKNFFMIEQQQQLPNIEDKNSK